MKDNDNRNLKIQLHILIYNIITCLKRAFKIPFNYIKKAFRKDSEIFLIGTPLYGNMGDQLIAVGELEWLQHYFPSKKIQELTHEELMKDTKCRLLLSQVKGSDLIFLQGGGNLNDKYINCEKIRRTIIKKCKQNKIILFPQSINFSSTAESLKIKKETELIYNSHSNFTVIAREDTSYKNALEMFPDLKVIKFPDMATILFNKVVPSQDFIKNGIGFCIRNDAEKYYSQVQTDELYKKLEASYKITKTDTHINRMIELNARSAEVQKIVDSFAKYKVIITDRFHGVIFSVLSNTPCIVLRSNDHKIVDGVKWFVDCKNILYADDIDNIPELVNKAFNMTEPTPPDFSNYFENLYKELKF